MQQTQLDQHPQWEHAFIPPIAHPYSYPSPTRGLASPSDRVLGNATVSGSSSLTRHEPANAFVSSSPAASTSATHLKVSKSPHQGAELFDAIVQAADPKHPDHAAWKDRYGSTSKRSSRTSFSSTSKRDRFAAASSPTPNVPQASIDKGKETSDPDAYASKRDSWKSSGRRSRNRHSQSDNRGSDAEDSFDASEGSADGDGSKRASYVGSVKSGHGSIHSGRAKRTSSVSSSRARRRRTKGKAKAPVPPIPPPRVTSSTNWQATVGSPTMSNLNGLVPIQDEQIENLASSSRIEPGHDSKRVEFDTSFSATRSPTSGGNQSPLVRSWRHERPLPSLPIEHERDARALAVASPPTPTSFSRHIRDDSISTSGHGFTSNASSSHYNSAISHPEHSVESAPSNRPTKKGGDRPFFTLPRSLFSPKPSPSATETHAQPQPSGLVSPSLNPERLSPTAQDAPYPSRKSMSKIRQVLGSEASEVFTPSPRQESFRVAQAGVRTQTTPTLQVDENAGRPSVDAARALDLRAFPVRRDDEFQSNDFELSDSDNELDRDEHSYSVDPRYEHHTHKTPDGRVRQPGSRVAGVVRRSLDSVISPFRASLAANASKQDGKKGTLRSQTSLLELPKSTSGRQSLDQSTGGRRSFSESRLVRPFLRQKPTVRGGRPLSRVIDSVEPTVDVDATPDFGNQDASKFEGFPPETFLMRQTRSPMQHHAYASQGYGATRPSMDADYGRSYLRAGSTFDSQGASSAHGLLPAAEVVGDDFDRSRRVIPASSVTGGPRAHAGGFNDDGQRRAIATLEHASPAFSRLSSEDKRSLLARNTYFLPSKEPTSRPGSTNDSSNTHGALLPSDSQHSGFRGPSLPSMSSSRSLASSFSRSTSNPHGIDTRTGDTSFSRSASATPTSQSRSKFSGILDRVKGSFTPGRSPSTGLTTPIDSPSTSVVTPSQSWSIDVTSNSFGGSHDDSHVFRTGTRSTSESHGHHELAMLNAGYGKKKEDRQPLRMRVKSFTSSKNKAQKAASAASPPIEDSTVPPPLPPGEKWRRELLSEVVGHSLADDDARIRAEALAAINAQPASKASDQAGRSFVKLLRKKKTQENLDEVIQSFAAPKMLHPDVAGDEAAPRPSMSSARGFVITSPEDEALIAGGVAPQTIRKTLSPALLSDTVSADIHNVIEEASEEGQSSSHAEAEEVLPQDKTAGDDEHNPRPIVRVDETEELNEQDLEQSSVQAPMRRFIRRTGSFDRLSRVEERSERNSVTIDSLDVPLGTRNSLSAPDAPATRSFGEHRQIRRSVSGNVAQHSSPPSLDISTARGYQYGKQSMDVPRSKWGADSPISTSSPALSRASRSPRKMSFSGTRSPAWTMASFGTPRLGRTSFSQDRDRSAVASPISPMREKTGRSPAILQNAMKKVRGKSSKNLSKGIGPGDVAFAFDDGDDEELMDERESMQLGRPSMDPGSTPGRSSFAAAEMMTKLLEAQANAMAPSPITPSFQSRNASLTGLGQAGSDTDGGSMYGSNRNRSEDNVGLGLGLGSMAGMPGASGRSFSASQIMRSPELGSSNGSIYTPKTPEMMAFADMLGKFGEKEKQLFKGISARVGDKPSPNKESCEYGTASDGGGGIGGGMASSSASTTSLRKEPGDVVAV